jgi:hypothetical protein
MDEVDYPDSACPGKQILLFLSSLARKTVVLLHACNGWAVARRGRRGRIAATPRPDSLALPRPETSRRCGFAPRRSGIKLNSLGFPLTTTHKKTDSRRSPFQLRFSNRVAPALNQKACFTPTPNTEGSEPGSVIVPLKVASPDPRPKLNLAALSFLILAYRAYTVVRLDSA